ncbi:hypothetical protein MMC21_006599 [Puttea exsequens]|nr:hypothetical protein [Puttea exsequens]
MTFNPWISAHQTLTFITLYNDMIESGFAVKQLRYVLQVVDDVHSPQYPDAKEAEAATSDLTEAKGQLIHDPEARSNGPELAGPSFFAAKLKYIEKDKDALLKAKGILTSDEILSAKQLPSDLKWSGAIERTARQGSQTFDLTLAAMVLELELSAARVTLLVGDVPTSADSIHQDHSTGTSKRT